VKKPIRLGKGEGENIWFLGNLATVKASKEVTSGWALVEVLAPAGYEPPLHVHLEEDEAFYILAGELLFTIGDDSFTSGPGAFVLSPMGVPHTIRAERETRWLSLAPSGLFVDLIRDVGEPAGSRTLPVVGAPEFDELRKRAAKHGIQFLR
jgi:mannose-6-phosphate isomerase-like protein (cupin superfamily)